MKVLPWNESVLIDWLTGKWAITIAGMLLTFRAGLGIKEEAAVAATRGDLGQLAPRKKLLKSW